MASNKTFKAFLKIDGINGPSPDEKHNGWIELVSFNHSMTQAGSFGKDGQLNGGSANVKEFTVTKEQDVTSPTIVGKLLAGESIKNVVVHLQAAAGSSPIVFAKYEFTPVVVASHTISAGGDGEDGDKPLETIAFRFNIMRTEFTPYVTSASGTTSAGTTVRAGWDVGKSKADTSSVSV